MADRILAIDIETSGLLSQMLDYSSFPYKLLPSAKLHCVVVANVETGETWSAEKENVTKEWLRGVLKGCTHLIAHNGISFDCPVLKLFGVLDYRIGYLDQSDEVFGQPCKIIDTLLLSRLLSPDRYTPEGMGHSLEVWGQRLGTEKSDYRAACIAAGYIEKNSPKGEQFLNWTPLLLDYCRQDTVVTCKLFQRLWAEYLEYSGWHQAFKMESKLCDLALRREHFGFAFDEKAAREAVQDLQEKMKAIADSINPLLPPKPRNKGELAEVTPPATQLKTHKALYLPKVQVKKDGTLSATVVKFLKNQEEITYEEGSFSFWFNATCYELPYYEALVPEFTEPTEAMVRFAQKVDGTLDEIDGEWILFYKGQMYPLPYNEPLETHIEADIDNIDWVKSYLIECGWHPLEYRQRNLICDSKKQSIPYEKRLAALQRYVKETLEDGKYKEQRLEVLELDENSLFSVLAEKIKSNKPVLVPTSPMVRLGVEKELCPNLTKLGSAVSFAGDFALYLTYKHRKNSIAGGISEDFDFDEESPPSGYLAQFREVDGRIPTPCITIGCNTTRYKHIGVCNIPRVSSVYGEVIRGLFGSGSEFWEGGFDINSLENCISGHYVIPFQGGQELAQAMVAAKPNDLHSLNAKKLGISRDDAKSFSYACLYGAQPAKLAKMLSISLKKAQQLYNDFWNGMPALKALKEKLEAYWEKSGKQHILGLDKRKIMTRSKHSLLNALFQSGGVISVKYATVFMMQSFEEQGYCTDPFVNKPEICPMIEMHDEVQLAITKNMVEIRNFETKELAEEFVSSWQGEQISPISKGKRGYYVAMPSVISRTITESLAKSVSTLKLRVNLGFEFKISRSWAGCH